MNWFVYLVKTPWCQKKQDWHEFQAVKREIKNARVYVENSERGVVRYFFEEDAYEEFDACLKHRLMYGRANIFDVQSHEYEIMRFQDSRCVNFVPEGNEQLCQCVDCPAFKANKVLYNARQYLNGLVDKRKNFWKNKFNQKSK